MSRAQTLDVNAAMIAAAAALAGGAIAYFALSFIARPAHLSVRLGEVTRQAAEAERIKTRAKSPSAYPSGAVCEGGAEAGAGLMRQTVTALAGQAGVAIADLQTQPRAPDERNGLQAVRLDVSASGSSAAVWGMMQSLSKATPSVFVDNLELRPSDGALLLKLSGRMFCSAVRP
jgi:hypothetical protein